MGLELTNELREVHDHRSLDREFHTVGAEKEKERLARADRTSGTARRPAKEDQRLRVG